MTDICKSGGPSYNTMNRLNRKLTQEVDYNTMVNLPQINGVTLIGNKTAESLFLVKSTSVGMSIYGTNSSGLPLLFIFSPYEPVSTVSSLAIPSSLAIATIMGGTVSTLKTATKTVVGGMNNLYDTIVTLTNNFNTHNSDNVRHITATERTTWNTASTNGLRAVYTDTTNQTIQGTKTFVNDPLRSTAKSTVATNSGTIYATEAQIYVHATNTSNPHSTTKAQVGLGNADNTADSVKNVLSATKWTTARTITINSASTTTAASIDGTANASVGITVNASMPIGFTQPIFGTNSLQNYIQSIYNWVYNTENTIFTISDYFTNGVAKSALKWESPITITYAGALTGAFSFDGSSSVTATIGLNNVFTGYAPESLTLSPGSNIQLVSAINPISDGRLTSYKQAVVSFPAAASQRVDLTSTSAGNAFSATTIGVQGVLPIANGGTGNTTGRAASADKLTTPRIITMDGSIQASATWDGSTSLVLDTGGQQVAILQCHSTLLGRVLIQFNPRIMLQDDGIASYSERLAIALSEAGTWYPATGFFESPSSIFTAIAVTGSPSGVLTVIGTDTYNGTTTDIELDSNWQFSLKLIPYRY